MIFSAYIYATAPEVPTAAIPKANDTGEVDETAMLRGVAEPMPLDSEEEDGQQAKA